jgi:hypothetical protein
MLLYLDGCSMIHGMGLPRTESLAALMSSKGGYDVIDKSRNGKSNISIALDAYRNWDKCDIFVLGFTYSSRFGLEFENTNLDFYAGFQHNELRGDVPAALSDEFIKVYKYFYLTFSEPYSSDLSDMLVDYTVNFLKSKNKKVFALTWENRKSTTSLYRPYMGTDDRQPDGHLNEQGTQKLYDIIQNELWKT